MEPSEGLHDKGDHLACGHWISNRRQNETAIQYDYEQSEASQKENEEAGTQESEADGTLREQPKARENGGELPTEDCSTFPISKLRIRCVHRVRFPLIDTSR